MTVNLLPIINIEGKTLSISDTIDLSHKSEADVIFTGSTKVDAVFTVLGGGVNLVAKVSCPTKYICDRCGEAYKDLLEFEFEEVLKKEAFDNTQEDTNPDVVYFTGNLVDLDEIVYKNIFMSLPSKKLCRKDCKGLCPKCGQNLNEGDCNCDTRTSDPRFDVLDNFFK